MVDHGPRIGVVKEIEQFFFDIAIVHIEGGAACLEGSQHPLEVFIPVIEIEGYVILTGFPIGQSVAFMMTAQAVLPKDLGQPAGSIGGFSPAESFIAVDDAIPFGNDLGNRFVDMA